MIRKSSFLISGIVLVCLLLSFLAGCTGIQTGKETNNASSSAIVSEITLVELYHFHGNQQCYSCKKLGDMAEEVANTFYADELASGKLVFGHINAEDPKNVRLAEQYGVVSSSLMLGVHTKDSFVKQEIIEGWYRLDNKEEFDALLRKILDPLLKGDNS